MTRYYKLIPAVACCLAAMAGLTPAAAQSTGEITLAIDTVQGAAPIAPDFTGLGYEKSAIALPAYFSPDDTVLIRLYRLLSPHGLIRIGGNVSDHTRYEEKGVSQAHTERETTVINHRDLVRFAAFARATGWRVMWGLNLGTGSPEAAAAEAAAVAQALGPALGSFQVGNEVDLQGHYQHKYPDFDSYYADYLSFRKAILLRVPGAPFSGPDVAGNLNWFRQFAERQSPGIRTLTFHYYRTGARNPKATIDTLLAEDTRWTARTGQLAEISRQKGVPYRINEVNSFSGGGKEGVSDVFASALWCLDYMYRLAAAGCGGVNIETDINQLGWISHYSPVVHDSTGRISVRPEFYGMLAFALGGRGRIFRTSLHAAPPGCTAYATGRPGGALWITLINKEAAKDVRVRIALPRAYRRVRAYTLSAPSLESVSDVTLGGTTVGPDGRWNAVAAPGKLRNPRAFRADVPHGSALVLSFAP